MEIKRKTYAKPEIIHELDLETRAGSSPVDQITEGFAEFDEQFVQPTSHIKLASFILSEARLFYFMVLFGD